MGRTILADEIVQTYVEKLLGTNTWYLGLIIGKLTSQKDYGIHMVRTPEPVEDAASDEDDDISLETSGKKKRRKSQSKPANLVDMNEQWAATHAKQVTTMLPGGLSVIGVFAIASPAMMQAAQAKLRQVIYAIHKMTRKVPVERMGEPITDRLLLQICLSTRKYTCRTIDVNDPKSAFRPADWRYSSSPEKWNRVESDLGINLSIEVPQRSTSSTFTKQIQTGLQPFCKRVWDSYILIDGATKQETDILDQSTDKKVKGRDKGQNNQQIYKCNILVKLSPNSTGLSDPHVGDFATKLMLNGTIHSRAYVVGKATVEDAKNAIKTDVIRSVTSRCELLCDDIQVVEEDAEIQEVYTTPRRVFYRLPGTRLELCDYMFQDEKIQEVIGRIQELLDITLSEEDIDMECEKPATDEDCLLLSPEDSSIESRTGEISGSGKSLKYYLAAGLGGAVAFLAAGLSYVFSDET